LYISIFNWVGRTAEFHFRAVHSDIAASDFHSINQAIAEVQAGMAAAP
jgi:hypothetical protein